MLLNFLNFFAECHAVFWLIIPEHLVIQCCGSISGSLKVFQPTEAVVPGSNPASPTVKHSEDRQSQCVYHRISTARREKGRGRALLPSN